MVAQGQRLWRRQQGSGGDGGDGGTAAETTAGVETTAATTAEKINMTYIWEAAEAGGVG